MRFYNVEGTKNHEPLKKTTKPNLIKNNVYLIFPRNMAILLYLYICLY
jgi:hypothetical protein